MANVRKATVAILKFMDEGVLDPRVLAEACLSYMSEADVADMARINELLEDEDTGCGEDCAGASCLCRIR
jgi:hypothetical protein